MRIKTGRAVVLGWTMGAVMAGGVTVAQVPNASSGQMNHALGKVEQAGGTPDQVFLKKAIEGSHGEIDAAKLALTKSKNEQVKQFAQKMVEDHTRMLTELHQLEQKQTLKYADTASAPAMQMTMKLRALKGAAFDKAYVDGMVKDHGGDVEDFSKEVDTGKNEAIKGVAEKSLPVIKEHLQMVQELQKTIG